MSPRKPRTISFLFVLLAAISIPRNCWATSIQVDSSVGGWTATVPSAGVTVLGPLSPCVTYGFSFTNDCGYGVSPFDGFWQAHLTFFIPASATDVKLTISLFNADDRAVMLLNGTDVGSTGGSPFSGGLGSMVLSYGGPLVDYVFPGYNSSFESTAGFELGAVNHLDVTINNTGHFMYGPLRPLPADHSDGTYFRVTGNVTFTEPLALPGGGGQGQVIGPGITASKTLAPVPEPTSLILFATGLTGLISRARRSKARLAR